MTEFRVLQEGDYFYPQRKVLWWWWCYIDNYEDYYYSICYTTLEEAYDYLDRYIKSKEVSKQRKVYKYPPE